MKRTLLPACIAAAALLFGAMTATPASAAGDFYTPPTTLPAANGALVKTEPMKLGASFRLAGKTTSIPGTATRIMYKSTDDAGKPAGVTGVYIEPSAKWTGKGPRPLVSFSAGTQGQGDACAPSKTLEQIAVFQDGQISVGYEIPSIYQFLAKGVAVVVTDYIGLGTTDRLHTYVNRVDMGHAVIDAARAASKVPGASVTAQSPVGFYGYSQGGGAAGAAVELAPTYAPELNLKGAYVGAPPANLFDTLKHADGTMLVGVLGYAINGLKAYDPSLETHVQNLVSDAGRQALETIKNQCIGNSAVSYAFQKTSKWTKSGKPAWQVVQGLPDVMNEVNRNKIGKVKPNVPVMVLTGTQDDVVPHKQARQLAVDWCGKKANVTYRAEIQLLPSGGTGLNHITPMITGLIPSNNWMMDRLNGKSVSSNCGLMWLMP